MLPGKVVDFENRPGISKGFPNHMLSSGA
jgi:hypothetical protein